jgi:hypothetical protein
VLLVDVVKAHVDAINEHGLEFVHLDGRTEIYKNMKATMDTTRLSCGRPCDPAHESLPKRAALEKNKSLIAITRSSYPYRSYGNADEIVKFVPEEQIVLGTSGGARIVAGRDTCSIKGRVPPMSAV